MNFEFKDGFCYTKFNIDHPLVERYYSKKRFRLHPETVVQLCEDVPELRSHLDYDFYKKWADRKSKISHLKDDDRFAFDGDFKVEPFDHQKKAIAFILYTPAQALFAEPGTGKTYCALVAAQERIKRGLCKKVLVISPASVMKTGWYRDLKQFTDLKGIIVHRNKWRWNCPACGTRHYRFDSAKKHMEKCGLKGDPDEELLWNQWDKAPEVLEGATDYDIYITSIDLAHLYLDDFERAGFDFMILDESTLIKNPTGERTKSMHRLGHSCKYRLAMTGTPITNELEDIWSQMQFVDMPFDSTIGRFRRRYYWQHPAHHWIKKPNPEAGAQIAQLTRNSVLRIKKEDCLDLPPRLHSVREITPSDEVKRVYKKFYKDLYARHKGEEVIAFNTLTEILRLHQIINGYWTDDTDVHLIDETPTKVKEVKSILEAARRKVIIWTYYRQDAKILKRELEEYKPAVVNGSTRNVDNEVESFLKNDACRVMIAHPKSARFGHTWTVADTTIFYTYGYSVEDYWQARDRNHRIGQDRPVNEIFLSYGGIEDVIVNSVLSKEDFSKKMMENFEPNFRLLSL